MIFSSYKCKMMFLGQRPKIQIQIQSREIDKDGWKNRFGKYLNKGLRGGGNNLDYFLVGSFRNLRS